MNIPQLAKKWCGLPEANAENCFGKNGRFVDTNMYVAQADKLKNNMPKLREPTQNLDFKLVIPTNKIFNLDDGSKKALWIIEPSANGEVPTCVTPTQNAIKKLS